VQLNETVACGNFVYSLVKSGKTVCVSAELFAKSEFSICNCHWDTPCARFEWNASKWTQLVVSSGRLASLLHHKTPRITRMPHREVHYRVSAYSDLPVSCSG